MSYELTTKENATLESSGRFLRPASNTEETKRIAEEAAARWHIHYELEWRSSAQSDGGIDATETHKIEEIPVTPDMIVLDGGEAVGIFAYDHLFLFAEWTKHTFYTNHQEKGFVGGWGDISETDIYSIKPGPAPLNVVEVAAAIIKDGDRYLATQRGHGDWEGWWEFPGGKLEEGEDHRQAAVREIKEELGLTIAVDTYLTSIVWYYPTFTLRMHVDLCTVEEGELNLKEHKDAKWLKLDELCSVKWLPADAKACKSLKWYEEVYNNR